MDAPLNVGRAASARGRRGRATVKVLAAGVVIVVGVLGIYSVAKPGSDRGDAAQSDLARAVQTSFDITTTATGDLQARNQIELRSELDSDTTIVEILPEGTQVKKGEVVIRLNGDELKTNIDEEELRVESAKAELVAAENAYEIQKSENDSKHRQAKLKLELARLALDQWAKGEHVQKRKDIDLELERADRDLKRLEKKVDKNKALLAEGFLSQDEFDREEIEWLEAKAALEKAQLADETYKQYEFVTEEKSKQSDVDEAAAELARVEAQNEIELTSKNAERLNQRRQLQIRQDRLDNLRRQFAACTMIAPSDGLVVYAVSAGRGFMSEDQPLQVGRSVRPRETLVVLPDTSEMVAVVKVHESLAGRIRPGQSSSVRIDMLGQSYGGRVDSIGVMAETGDRWRDPNRREYSVRIALSHGDQRDLRPSMRCEATVTLGRVDQVVAVPVQAVFSSDDQVRFVYTPRNGRFARVPVRVGRRSDVFAEIAAGLSAGDRVLLRLPTPGEVITEAWNREALKVAGVEVDAEGNPVVARPANMQTEMPGMNAGGGAPTGADAGRFGGREGGRPGGGPNGERRGNRGRGPRNGESANGNDREGTTGGGTDGTNTESTEKPTESTEKPADSPTRGG